MVNIPLLTIGIPTYKRAQEVDELLSLLEFEIKNCAALKNGEVCLEILVSDNCSPDHTTEVLERWASQIPELAYWRNSVNVGLIGNLYELWKRASGTYFWCLSDDDRLLPGAIGVILEVLRNGEKSSLNLVVMARLGLHYDEKRLPFAATLMSSMTTKRFENGADIFHKVQLFWITFVSCGIYRTSLLKDYDPFTTREPWELATFTAMSLRAVLSGQSEYIGAPLVIHRNFPERSWRGLYALLFGCEWPMQLERAQQWGLPRGVIAGASSSLQYGYSYCVLSIFRESYMPAFQQARRVRPPKSLDALMKLSVDVLFEMPAIRRLAAILLFKSSKSLSEKLEYAERYFKSSGTLSSDRWAS